MAHEYDNLLVETGDGIATVVINNPDKLNALNASVLDDLEACFGALAEDDEVRGIIVTGAGEKAFVAGADIKELNGKDRSGLTDHGRRGQQVFQRIAECDKPTVAAINGYALGGGLELALACHFRVAATTARVGLPEVSLGLIPGYGGTQRLPRIIGQGRALEMICTGRQVEADEALDAGLVSRTAPADQVVDAARDLLGSVLKNSPAAVSAAIRAVRHGEGRPLAEALQAELELFGACADTEDMKEGTSAFLDKRKPEFTGK